MGDSEIEVQFDIHLKLLKIRLIGSAVEEGAAGLEAMRLKVRREGGTPACDPLALQYV